MADAKKYLDLAGLQTYHGKLKSEYYVDGIPSVVNRTGEGTTQSPYSYTLRAEKLYGTIANGVLANTPTSKSADGAVATKKYVDDAVQDITSAMVFKGGVTATTASNTTTLTLGDATLADINEGYTFKFTANETGGTTFKIGDILIANEDITHTAGATITYDYSKWTLVPSGDDVDVTSVGVSNAEGAIITLHTSESGDAAITSTGTISATHENSGVTAGTYGSGTAQSPNFGGTASVPYVTVNATGHITTAGTANVTIPDTAATANAKGLVQIGTNIGVNDGVISVATANGASTLGLVKQGDRVTIDNGTISADLASTTNSTAGAVLPDGTIITLNESTGAITVADASTTNKGVVQVGSNINVNNGTISVPFAEATAGKVGVVKQGTNISIDGTTGAISVATASAGNLGVATVAADTSGGLTIASGGVLAVNPILTDDINALFPQS